MDIISTLLAFAKGVFGLKTSIDASNREQADRVADYIDTVAKTISDAATELRLGNIPHGKCGEMAGHAQLFEKTVSSVVDAGRAKELADQLQSVYDIERAYAELQNVLNADKRIAELDEAAGLLRAFAASLRVTS